MLVILKKKKKGYWIRFNNTFLRTCCTCPIQIVGCYSPNGDHCEKPLEIALKANQAIISLGETKTNSIQGKTNILYPFFLFFLFLFLLKL